MMSVEFEYQPSLSAAKRRNVIEEEKVAEKRPIMTKQQQRAFMFLKCKKDIWNIIGAGTIFFFKVLPINVSSFLSLWNVRY